MSKADYGIDAPPVIRNLTLFGSAALLAGLILGYGFRDKIPWLAILLVVWGVIAGVSMLITAGLMVWSSKVGKLRERERLLDSLDLDGDETVLDVGCGRGLLLVGVAHRLTTGRAIGIDLWQSIDQSGNRPEVALANAQAEDVAERVDIRTGDMRQLPFEEDTIDVVLSSLAIHNIPDKAGRAQAMREIARVLKPGGQVALLDFQCTEEYTQVLRNIGWREVDLSGRKFRMFPPVRIVSGRKPAQ